ncbi:hypothetical protein [Halorussus salinus]|uniref:hypothetical protein n=1 Tax=Halorussus salinus TaxID=1364935 RepID=UPI0010921AB4|nr:hypothetical protein [Halorussus salinus]
MVQVGLGTLFGIGITVLVAALGVLYKLSVNLLSVSKNISNLNNSLGIKLDELNESVNGMSTELRRISETTAQIETRLDSRSASNYEPSRSGTGEARRESDFSRDENRNHSNSDGNRTNIEGEYTLSETGVTIDLERRFLPTTTGSGRYTIDIEFQSDILVNTERLVDDIAVLIRGFGYSPEIREDTSNGNTVVSVALYTFDGEAVDEWMKATLRLLDNEMYYKSIDIESGNNDEYVDADFENVEEADIDIEENQKDENDS